jgi:hypothetical protein
MQEDQQTFECPPFPPVAIEADGGFWSGDIELEGDVRPMTLYFDRFTPATFKQVAGMLSELAALRTKARLAIHAEALADPTIRRDFFLFHLEEIPGALPGSLHAKSSDSDFIEVLKLSGVGIHEHTEVGFEIWLDFSYGREVTDELLSVKFVPDGSIRCVSHES